MFWANPQQAFTRRPSKKYPTCSFRARSSSRKHASCSTRRKSMQPPPMCEGTSSPQTLSGSRSALLRVLGVMPGRGAEGFCS